ncbi:MAG: cytochrome-c oxidase, cbb3-type subunit I [Sandaracinaceae bacterium]
MGNGSGEARTVTVVYNDTVVRQFAWATVLWGIVGLLVGVVVALQLAYWPANFAPWLTFGRLRPLHTNAAIFAFVGNMMFAGVYHSTQRLAKARLGSDLLSSIHFWGWQAIIVAAAITLPLGLSQGKEYAELIWPIDIAVTLIWVVFAVNFFWTLAQRNEKHLYVAIWFYIATIITVAMLYIVNNLAMPVGALFSYSLFGGVQDGLVQWWYGHNAVAFFLTTPILGIMYYYLPKAANRPVFSYRLSIVHFWGLVFIYIWAGPHHLLNTALPEWAQSLGMIFSLMLWAPSWGGMLNGLLTLRGAWDKLRKDPVLKFFAVGVTFYGMSTFEGPLLSIRSVNSLSHYTDWTIGHVHSGTLGWNGFMAAGMLYWLVPRMYGTKLKSIGLADVHFYIGTIGILIYVVSMWVGGVTQGLMWRAETAEGGLLYPNFVETVNAIRPMYWARLVGGSLYLVGFVIMAYNLVVTALGHKPTTTEVKVVVEPPPEEPSWVAVLTSREVLLTVAVGLLVAPIAVVNELASTLFAVVAVMTAVLGVVALQLSRSVEHGWHRILEGKALLFTLLVTVGVVLGGVVELIPMAVRMNSVAEGATHQTYSALELRGRDIYVAEGCYNCHSQMIRPFTWESSRYGAVSTLEESVWDHPFQWGSKRTGPDLSRESERYPGEAGQVWHYNHMLDPRSTSPGSIMPAYPHLRTTPVAFDTLGAYLRAQQIIGVPYTDEEVRSAPAMARSEARAIAESLRTEVELDGPPDGVSVPLEESQLVAMIAYLQRLGSPRRVWTPGPEDVGGPPIQVSQAEPQEASDE